MNKVLPWHYSLVTILAHHANVTLIENDKILLSRLASLSAGWIIPVSQEVNLAESSALQSSRLIKHSPGIEFRRWLV